MANAELLKSRRGATVPCSAALLTVTAEQAYDLGFAEDALRTGTLAVPDFGERAACGLT